MTLPLIYSLSISDRSEKREIINIIKNHNTDDKKVKFVLDFVNRKGGITYATSKMMEFRDQAVTMMRDFPRVNTKRR